MAQRLGFSMNYITEEEEPVVVSIPSRFLYTNEEYDSLSLDTQQWCNLMGAMEILLQQEQGLKEEAQQGALENEPLIESIQSCQRGVSETRKELRAYEMNKPEMTQEIGRLILESWGLQPGDLLCTGASESSANWKRVRLDYRGLPYVAIAHPDDEGTITHYTYEPMAHKSMIRWAPGVQDWRRRTVEWEDQEADFAQRNGEKFKRLLSRRKATA